MMVGMSEGLKEDGLELYDVTFASRYRTALSMELGGTDAVGIYMSEKNADGMMVEERLDTVRRTKP